MPKNDVAELSRDVLSEAVKKGIADMENRLGIEMDEDMFRPTQVSVKVPKNGTIRVDASRMLDGSRSVIVDAEIENGAVKRWTTQEVVPSSQMWDETVNGIFARYRK